MPSSIDINSLNPKENIIIKGARVHNLKNIDVAIPRNKFVVITGVSGSGKSSLAFDTLYAEGQRRYVESLSSYARQFLGKLDKPDVDYIKGISPAIAIEQKVNTRNPRSTVGTSTEIYDYLKLLFARIGKTFSPVSGKQVKRDTVEDVVKYIHSLDEGTKVYIFSPLNVRKGRNLSEQLSILQQQGFSRVKFNDKVRKIDELLEDFKAQVSKLKVEKSKNPELFLLIDRIEVKYNDEENQGRIADSVQTAFYEGEGELELEIVGNQQSAIDKNNQKQHTTNKRAFSNKFELDGMKFEEPSVHFFSFNNPVGACKTCEGFGSIIGIDEDLVVPNKSLSIFEEAIVCWKGEKMSEWKDKLILNNHKFDFPIHKPYYELTEEQKRLLWTGNKYFRGLNDFFKFLEQESYKIQYRVMLSRYRGKTMCYDCRGTRLRRDANYVKVAGKSITDIVLMPVKDSLKFFKELEKRSAENSAKEIGEGKKTGKEERETQKIRETVKEKRGREMKKVSSSEIPLDQLLTSNSHLTDYEYAVAKRLLLEIVNRLKFLNDVGLGYLTLNRLSSTLSGGESQRINLATSLGSSLVGSMYILDEPSIGLHPRDTQQLIGVLQSLKKLGNTVIVVEHDEEIMQQADHLIDLGPEAGTLGGELVFQGRPERIETLSGAANAPVRPMEAGNSLTLKYLLGKEIIETPLSRRKWKNYIEIVGAKENNLKNISVKFPLEIMTVVTGVSGSGKSSLVKKILFPAFKKIIQQAGSSYSGFIGSNEQTGNYDTIKGDFSLISGVEFVDQNPIGKSSRSNPVTYLKAYDDIRLLFSEQKLSKLRGYTPGNFSFNVDGGRCEVCSGEGEITVEMQFMADVHLVCEECKGKRFKEEILEVEYHGKNISEVLLMTVDNAVEFFQAENEGVEKRIVAKLKTLQDVGLGYVQLGQSSSTLSGGEAQRIKLASFLGMGSPINNSYSPGRGAVLFIFDEPTTGLHFHDIKKLLKAFNALIDQGHSIVIIEHNPEVIKSADWVIDLGPEGGDEGGKLVFEGTPEGLVKSEESHTGKFLRRKM